MFEDKQDVFTVDDVSALLRVCSNTVYKIVASGELKSRRIGRKIIITKNDLIDYLEQTTTYPQQQVYSSVGKGNEQ